MIPDYLSLDFIWLSVLRSCAPQTIQTGKEETAGPPLQDPEY